MRKILIIRKIIFLLFFLFLFSIQKSNAQCYAISNTSNTNNPTFTHTFTLTPDVGSTAITNMHSIRLRTSDNNAWRLTGSRVAITRSSGSGAAADNILDTDVSWSATVTNVGVMAGNTCALAAPFSGTTTLNSISTAGGTVIANGNRRTSNNCTTLGVYWQVDVTLSIPQDFVFNMGTYTGMITYTLSN